MRRLEVEWREIGTEELARLVERPGVVVVRFVDADGPPLAVREAQRLAAGRAVTVADVDGSLAGGALEAALLFDLVVLRQGAVLECDPGAVPPPAVLRVAARAGRHGLRRVLLEPGPIPADEAVRLGLAAAVIPPGGEVPLSGELSCAALTAARDLLRASAPPAARLALEHATFRLLFATGDPQEGARAFLGRRPPRFS